MFKFVIMNLLDFDENLKMNSVEIIQQKKLFRPNQNELKNTIEQLESTRIDNEEKNTSEEKDTDQLPDYSTYDEDVNASILRVLRDEEEPTSNQQVILNDDCCLIRVWFR